MESAPHKKCSICGAADGHNRTTCPNRPIEDTRPLYEEETFHLDPRKASFLQSLEDREAYDISPELYMMWLKCKRPIQLQELKYIEGKGLHKDSLQIYLDIVSDINEYF